MSVYTRTGTVSHAHACHHIRNDLRSDDTCEVLLRRNFIKHGQLLIAACRSARVGVRRSCRIMSTRGMLGPGFGTRTSELRELRPLLLSPAPGKIYDNIPTSICACHQCTNRPCLRGSVVMGLSRESCGCAQTNGRFLPHRIMQRRSRSYESCACHPLGAARPHLCQQHPAAARPHL